MRRKILGRVIITGLKFTLPIAVLAYGLRAIDQRFDWVLVAAVVILLWFGVAGVAIFFEFLIGEDQ